MHTRPFFLPHASKVSEGGCITLIGMAAAGKSTIGRELSSLTGWPQMDTDNLIESAYGAPLQEITKIMNKDEFLDLESQVLLTIACKRVIISTGGSAIYREQSMNYLKTLGPIIYLSVPLPIIIERISRKPERGLAMDPGQTLEDLYEERTALYQKYADFTLVGGSQPPSVYATKIVAWLSKNT